MSDARTVTAMYGDHLEAKVRSVEIEMILGSDLSTITHDRSSTELPALSVVLTTTVWLPSGTSGISNIAPKRPSPAAPSPLWPSSLSS